MIVFDSDDFGCNHVISDMCQSHDCRDALLHFKEVNPLFRATLFAIPGEMTKELLLWSKENEDWIELAFHGMFHTSNYECDKLTFDEFDRLWTNNDFDYIMGEYFVQGFKAPGWQISDGVYRWLDTHGFWVADQPYNDNRRPQTLPVYHINENSIHTHTWDCVGNGVYELNDEIEARIKDETDFRFVSEMV